MTARCFKVLAAVAVMVLAAVPVLAAGSAISQSGTLQSGGVAITTVTWTADDTDGSIPTLVVGIPGQSYIFKIETNPGATAPTDNYDIAITTAGGSDLLGGAGANRDTSATETAYPLVGTTPFYSYVDESPTIAITGNSVNSAVGTVAIYSIPMSLFTEQLNTAIPLNSATLNSPSIDSPTITGPVTLNETLAADLSAQTCAGWGLTTPVGATSCTDNPLTITRTASGSNLTLTYAGTQTVVPGTVYEIVATYTITAGSMSSTIGGRAGAAYSTTTTTHEYFPAGTSGKHIITFVAASAGTITGISVNAITNTISASEGPVVTTAALSSAGNQVGAVDIVTGTKSAGIMSVRDFVDGGSGGTRYHVRGWNGATNTWSIATNGAGTFVGGINAGNSTLWTNSAGVHIGVLPVDATTTYLHIDTLAADTAGAPATGDCDASAEVGRVAISTRYSATAEYRLWACVQTGASTFAWYRTDLTAP